jgi:hypothetical protein
VSRVRGFRPNNAWSRVISARLTGTTNMQQIVFIDGMKPGHGINLLTGDLSPAVAVRGTITPIEFGQGQNVTSEITRIDDVSSFHKALGVEVTADGSYMGFSANAKVSYADTHNLNSHSTYLLIHVEVKNAFVSMDDPVLSDDAIELLRNSQQDRFRERFGDVFITGVGTGGEYFAMYEISGTDESEKESVEVQVNASYNGLLASADLGVSVKNMTESSKSHLQVHASIFQLGGSDTTTDESPEGVMAKAHNFGPSVSGKFSVPYSVLPAPYRALKLPNDAANPIDIENQRQALADAWKLRNDLLSLKNDVDYVLLSNAEGHDEFEPFDVEALTAGRNALADQIDKITRGASECMRDALKCTFAKVDTSKIKLPTRKAVTPTAIALEASKGRLIANANQLVAAIRASQPDGPQREGFDIGMGAWQGNTLDGPGKQALAKSLTPTEQAGFASAAAFSFQWNNNTDFAAKGAAIAKKDPEVATARAKAHGTPPADLSAGLYWLGFDIATGIFGDPKLGAQGNTLIGPGSAKIRATLGQDAQNGFDDSLPFNVLRRS